MMWGLEANIVYSLAAVWALLIVATILVLILAALKPQKDYTELKLRTRSWWFMIAIFTGAIVIRHYAALYLFGFISFLALKEYFSMIPTRRADRRVLFWAYLAIPLQYYWAGISWYGMFIVFIPVYMFLVIATRMLLTQKTEGFLKAVGTIHWGLMTTVFSLSHAAYLLMLPARPVSPTGGAGMLIFLVVLTQFNDVAQYTWGKLFGRIPIVPAISPKKTWAGFLGGIVTSMGAAALIAPYLTPLSTPMAVAAGGLIAVTGFIGDVIISAIKRDIGVKDSGNLIPGHGGIMDRMDSLTFTAPQFFYFMCYFYGY